MADSPEPLALSTAPAADAAQQAPVAELAAPAELNSAAEPTAAPTALVAADARAPRYAAVRWVAAFLVTWAAIAAWRFEIIDSPPYSEFAQGLFMEANYLVETGFDYFSLRNAETWGNSGGSYIYMTSVLPTLLGLAMTACDSSRGVMIVAHSFTFALAALTLVSLYALVAPRLGQGAGLLAAVALLTTPLYGAQVDMLGLEVPMTAFALLAGLAAVRERYFLAAVAATLSFFMKPTGLIATLAVVTYLAIRFVLGTPHAQPSRRQLARGLLWNAAALFVQLQVYRWGGLSDRLTTSTMPFEHVAFWHVVYICPDLVLLFGVALSVTLVTLAAALGRGVAAGRPPGVLRRTGIALRDWIDAHRVLFFGWIALMGLATAIGQYGLPVARYFCFGVPFLYVVLASCLPDRTVRRRWPLAVLVVLIALNLTNTYGALYPELGRWARNGADLERSREYLLDHKANIAAVEYITRYLPDETLVVGHPFTFLLALPRAGYVDEPRPGFTVNGFARPEYRNVSQLFDERPREVVFVTVDNIWYALAQATVPPPGPDDQLLFTDNRPSPLVIYRTRLDDVAGTPEELDDWYLRRLWYDPTVYERPAMPMVTRANVLHREGKLELGIRLLRMSRADRPHDAELAVGLARLLVYAGSLEEAAELCQQATESPEQAAEAHRQLGLVRTRQQRLDEALQHWEASLALEPDSVPTRLHAAEVYLAENRLDEARRQLETLLRFAPQHAEAHYRLGMLLWQSGELEAAARALERAAQFDPDHPHAAAQRDHLRAALGGADGPNR